MDTNELIKYVKLLEGLMQSGFKCEKELGEALKALHNEMTKKINADRIFVVVLEEDFGKVVESSNVFKKLLGSHLASSTSNSHIELRSLNKVVLILSDSVHRDVLKGLSPDYIINNTNNPDLAKQLGLSA